MSNGPLPRLSVVIAADDHASPGDSIVDALAAGCGDHGLIEVLLIQPIGGSGGLAAIARIDRHAAAAVNLRLFPVAWGGRARMLNFGIRQATGTLVWLLGDDFIPEPGCAAAHLRFHEKHPEEQCVGVGPGIFPERLRRDPFRRWLEDSGELFGTSFTQPKPEELQQFFYGANTSFKRDFLHRVGLFDERFPFDTTDDYEFSVRARKLGMRVVHLPDARAVHEHDVRWRERRRSLWRSGFSNVWLEHKHPDLPAPSAQYRRSGWRYRVRSWKWWLRHLLSRDPDDRVRSWRYGLLGASVEGYHAGQAAGYIR